MTGNFFRRIFIAVLSLLILLSAAISVFLYIRFPNVMPLSIKQIVIISAAIVAISAAFSWILAPLLAMNTASSLNSLNLDDPLTNKCCAELSPLLKKIDLQQRKLKSREFELKRRSVEFEAVTASMNEGLVLLNKRGSVISINPSAKRILATDSYCIGQNILEINRSLELQQLLQQALNGEHTEMRIELSNEDYLFTASPVMSDDHLSGVALLMFNITQKESSEQMRREFTANVSHELKTPLHSISGYAELMHNGMVADRDISDFSGKIYAEAKRMIRLIDDIIKLSRLDEGVNQITREVVELYSIADDVLKSLETSALQADVKLSLSGTSVTITGFSQHIRGIIFNLCDNAIKYNRKGGSVFVNISNEDGCAVVSVRDTGIGIPPEHHARIFERFYSVDKSRSKEIGGTGLGLSIVKHAAKIHNATLNLESTPGEGTTITVRFPQ